MMQVEVRTLTERGQVTLPKDVRDLLRINTKDKVRFIIKDDKVTIENAKDITDLAGKFTHKMNGEEPDFRALMEKEY